MNVKKKLKIAGIVILCTIVVLAYPIYAIVVWNISKSPDDIAKFPTAGVWICENESFVMTIDLRSVDENANAIENMLVTIEFNGKQQDLKHYQGSGHGTPLAPTSPSDTIYFESAQSDSDNPNYIQFSACKYKFNENDFYLLDVSASQNDRANLIKQNMDLHFVKQ